LVPLVIVFIGFFVVGLIIRLELLFKTNQLAPLIWKVLQCCVCEEVLEKVLTEVGDHLAVFFRDKLMRVITHHFEEDKFES
jgi:hypothetical protein